MATIDLDAVVAAGDALFSPEIPHEAGLSLALVVMQSGEVVHERYGVQPDTVFGAGGPVGPDTTLISWSMAKSITHAAVGILVGDGRLHLEGPAPVPEWAGTAKEAITLQHLLNMRSGLLFVEDYVDDSVSHCLEMLYGEGKHDMAAYAAALPLAHQPGDVWNYASGSTNIVARIVGDVVAEGGDNRRELMESFLRDRLFSPAGMHTAAPKFDEVGTFVGSSYVYATARDFARFGELYRSDGVARSPDGAGTRVLPAGWRDHARTFTAHDDENGFSYGAHWWLWPDFPGSLGCHGYEGQYTVVLPDRELVVVHLGKYPAGTSGVVEAQLRNIFHAADG